MFLKTVYEASRKLLEYFGSSFKYQGVSRETSREPTSILKIRHVGGLFGRFFVSCTFLCVVGEGDFTQDTCLHATYVYASKVADQASTWFAKGFPSHPRSNEG